VKRPGALPLATVAAVVLALLGTLHDAWVDDMTTDEPIHLEWSRRLLESGETGRGPLHFNSKTPVVMANVLARKLARRHLDPGPRVLRWVARLPTVAWLALLLIAVFAVTRSFVGRVAAHLATIGTALDPSLIAHGALATVDVAYALATVLTLGAALAFARRPSLGWAGAVGLALGVAFATKYTAVLLIPGVLLLPLAWTQRPRPDRRTLALYAGSALTVFAVTCLVVSASYLFQGVGTPLSQVQWRSAPLIRAAALLPGFAPPVPRDFLTGFDIVLASERDKVFNVVILRRLYPDGVWFYFPLLWLWKTPVLLLAVQAFGLWRLLWTRTLGALPALRFLAANLALSLAYFCLVYRMQIGYRFVLMCIPLAWILAGAGLATLPAGPRAWAAGAVVVAITLAEHAPYLGNHLAFTNLAVQPKKDVFRLTADSNVDFGQNDEKVMSWLAAHPREGRHVEPVHILPGENVVNFNLASGAGLFRRHQWLRDHLRPREHFRHTFLVFEVDGAQFERFLEDARRLRPDPRGAAACPGGDGASPITSGDTAALPEAPGLTVVCVQAAGPADLVLHARQGELTWGRGELRPRDRERLAAGQEAWYRLEPGWHTFVAQDGREFQGDWGVRGGPLRAAFREVSATAP
jgi:4-amino-4-deoxy-L-arabinose transferase-like glycosyltransferase